MESFTYSNARQNLSRLLDIALKRGEVKVRRRDGTSFVIRPEKRAKSKSPLDLKGVKVKDLDMQDVFRAIKEGRKEY
jgi:hypothetical protein